MFAIIRVFELPPSESWKKMKIGISNFKIIHTYGQPENAEKATAILYFFANSESFFKTS